MSREFVLAWAVYVVVTFGLGFVWHLVLFRRTYSRLGVFSRIDDPVIPLGIAAMLIQGGILAYLYPLFPSSDTPLETGLRFGLVAGAFLASSAVVAEAAKQRVSSLSTWLVLETAYYLIQFAAVGVLIAMVYGRRG